MWDSGLRPVPPHVLLRSQAAVTAHMPNAERLSLDQLVREFGLHERTLRAAGRTAVQAFMRKDYRRYGGQSPAVAPLPSVPCVYDARLERLRRRLRLTQHDLARRVEAANKAVVYQWESRQRRPSPGLLGKSGSPRCDSAGLVPGANCLEPVSEEPRRCSRNRFPRRICGPSVNASDYR
jgi:hypothetical protein